MLHEIHGRICRKVGNRYFAMPPLRRPTLVDRLASVSASGIRSNPWNAVDRQTGRARVISNQR
jgi:hypothetical protein